LTGGGRVTGTAAATGTSADDKTDVAAGWVQKAGRGGLVLAICAATGILGLVRLGAKGLWHDEAFSEAMARLDLPTLWAAITGGEAFSGLYYMLLHFWLRWRTARAGCGFRP